MFGINANSDNVQTALLDSNTTGFLYLHEILELIIVATATITNNLLICTNQTLRTLTLIFFPFPDFKISPPLFIKLVFPACLLTKTKVQYVLNSHLCQGKIEDHPPLPLNIYPTHA